MIMPGKNIVPVQRAQYLRKKRERTNSSIGAVIEHISAAVCNDDPGRRLVFGLTENGSDRGGIDDLQSGYLLRHELTLFDHRLLFSLIEEPLAHLGAKQVQGYQDSKRDQRVYHGILELRVQIPTGAASIIS